MKRFSLPRPAVRVVFLIGWILAGQALALEPTPAPVRTPESLIPVLCYHRFGQYPPQDPYFVSADEFKRQLDIIAQEGYTPIVASMLEAGLSGSKPLPRKPILITIDDGYADVWTHARPMLQARGFTATLFIYPGYIGSRHGLTREQLQRLQSEGFEIGSHSLTHPKLIKRLPGETGPEYEKRLRAELGKSRGLLQQWLGTNVESLAYPYGLWDQTVAAAAAAAGYKLMFTVDPGTNTLLTPREQIKRIMIVHGTKDRTFLALLQEEPLALAARSLVPGEHAVGPVSSFTFRLAPEAREMIRPASLSVRKGSRTLELRYDANTGEATCVFSEPWVQGTDALQVTASDPAGRRHFKESWLATVDPPAVKEGD